MRLKNYINRDFSNAVYQLLHHIHIDIERKFRKKKKVNFLQTVKKEHNALEKLYKS